MKAIIIAVAVVIGMVVILQLQHSTEYVAEPVEIMEVEVTPTEEELRRMEWEKEAEEVKARHLKKKELEHERSVLLDEVKERETRIKELEKELGF
jgi:anti-sigma-K factor RskA